MTDGDDTIDDLLAAWPATHRSVVAVDRNGPRGVWGDPDAQFRLASVTKVLTATAVWVAIEEGSVALDDGVDAPWHPGGPVTLRHLLSHASGLGPEEGDPVVTPGTRRVYSNAGFDLIDRLLSDATGFPTTDYLRLGVLDPLSMVSTRLEGHAGHGAVGSAGDLARWAVEMLEPTILHAATVAEATRAQFPELPGVLPGYGPQRPNPWGLGVEIRGHKSPHWTAPDNSPETFGHFGRSGTFVWIDPVARLGLVGLGDVDFGPWAVDIWPRLSTAVLDRHRRGEL